MRKPYLLLFILLLFILSAFLSCKTSIDHKNSNAIQWGYKYSKIDKNQIHTQGIFSEQNCFPGFYEFKHEFTSIDLTIFSLSGEMVYHSKDFKENWICNSSKNTNYIPGVYVFKLIYTSKTNSAKDSLIGQIHLTYQHRPSPFVQ